MRRWKVLPIGTVLLSGLFATAGQARSPARLPATAWREKVDPWGLARASQGETEFLVFLRDQADLTAAADFATKAEKGAWVFRQLRDVAEATQAPVLAALAARGLRHESYWVANMIRVEGGLGTGAAMAARSDVARVSANPRVRFSEPIVRESERAAAPE